MSATDASLEFLRELDDPTRYTVKRRVPVFYAHEKTVTDPETKKRVTKIVAEADLPEWLEQLQAAERATGVAAVLRLGHVEHDLPDTLQSSIGGYYRNPVLERFGPERKLGILVDEYAKVEHVGALKDLPRRSVEMYRPHKRITAVAALSRDNQLPDLGFVSYAGGEPVECYSLETCDMDPMNPPAPETNAAATPPDLTAIIAAVVKAVMEQMQVAAPPAPPAPPADPAPDLNLNEDEEEPPVALQNQERAELYALRTKTTEMARQLAAEKRRGDQMAADLAVIRKDRDEAHVEKIVAELRAENYAFDDAEVLADLRELPDRAAREKYAARVRKNYPQVPGGRVELYAGRVEGGPTQEQMEAEEKRKKAFRKMNANPGMSFDEALAAV